MKLLFVNLLSLLTFGSSFASEVCVIKEINSKNTYNNTYGADCTNSADVIQLIKSPSNDYFTAANLKKWTDNGYEIKSSVVYDRGQDFLTKYTLVKP